MQHLYEALGKAILRPDRVMMSGLFAAHVCTCMYLFVCLQNSLVSKVRFFDALLLVSVTSIDCYSNRFFVPSFFFSLSLFLARLPFLFFFFVVVVKHLFSVYLFTACLLDKHKTGDLPFQRRRDAAAGEAHEIASFSRVYRYL